MRIYLIIIKYAHGLSQDSQVYLSQVKSDNIQNYKLFTGIERNETMKKMTRELANNSVKSEY